MIWFYTNSHNMKGLYDQLRLDWRFLLLNRMTDIVGIYCVWLNSLLCQTLYHNTEWCELWIQIRVWREWQNILLERVGWCTKRRHVIASSYAASYFPHPCTLIMSFKSQCDRFRKELVIEDLYTKKYLMTLDSITLYFSNPPNKRRPSGT